MTDELDKSKLEQLSRDELVSLLLKEQKEAKDSDLYAGELERMLDAVSEVLSVELYNTGSSDPITLANEARVRLRKARKDNELAANLAKSLVTHEDRNHRRLAL